MITIRGKAIRVSHEDIAQLRLRYFEANPRVYSMLRKGGKVPSQEDIQARLLQMEHVKELIQDIRRNGGLMEPILVRSGTLEVLEGNSRLAAYRALAAKEPMRWATIHCKVLPENLPDSETFALLAQLHVKGKKDWAKFEQAGFLYRRFHEQHVDLETLAEETSVSQRAAKQLIETYAFMLQSGEADMSHWSHYEEYLRSRVIQKTRAKFASFNDVVVGLIQADPHFRAQDVRDRLPKVCEGPTRTVRRFAEGKLSFEDAYEAALDAGADNTALRKLNKFRQWLADAGTARVLTSAEGQDHDKIAYELDKIRVRIVQLQNTLSRAGKKLR